MAELVKRNSCWPSLESSGGGIGGGGGGGAFLNRVGTHGGGSRLSSYHKSDSFAFQLSPGGFAKSDEEKFLSSLKADLHDEIVKSGARINASGDLETRGCHAEYGDEGIQGRIEISLRLAGGNYYSLTATLSETSTRDKPLLIEEPKHRHQPKGTYYVVPCPLTDPPGSTRDLFAIGQELIEESVENIRQQLLADQSSKDALLQNLEYAEVYIWKPIPAELAQRIREATGREFEAPAGCEQFEKVFFLNEVALGMYREAGEGVEVLKTISADEVSKILGPALRGPFMPKRA